MPQPVFAPLRRTYQLARLREQLQTATNGGRTNIFKVAGFGAQKLAVDAVNPDTIEMDAPGEPDVSSMIQNARRSSSFSMQAAAAASRQPSVSGRA